MMKKSHVVIGVIGALTIQHGTTLPGMLALATGALIGSMLPDLDLRLGIPHRGITHWLIWPALVFWFGQQHVFLIGLALGWALHIGADALTVEGLRPFWPVRWRVRGFLKTGSQLEYFFVVCGMGGLIYYFLANRQF